MKMGMKIKERSLRYDVNRLRPSSGHKHTEYKTCISMMMLACVKQHLSNI